MALPSDEELLAQYEEIVQNDETRGLVEKNMSRVETFFSMGRNLRYYGDFKSDRQAGFFCALLREAREASTVKAPVTLPVKFQKFKPTKYQRAWHDAMINNDEHLVVEAVAGSGKTTTLEWLMWVIDGLCHVLFLAFNKRIAAELADRIQAIAGTRSLRALTLHALGNRSVRKTFNIPSSVNPDGRKYRKIADKMLAPSPRSDDADQNKVELSIRRRALSAIAKLVDMCRSNIANPASHYEIIDLIDQYSIDVPAERREEVFALLPKVLAKGLDMLRHEKMLDFGDMIYAPVFLKLQVATGRVIFIDETQDLDKAKVELAIRAAGDTGRIVAVGDRNQSIYAWAGADSKSIPRLIARLAQTKRGVMTLPLSQSFRCPRLVVKLINILFPHIAFEAADNAIEGVVRTAEAQWEDNFSRATTDTAILNRRNAPLFGMCMKLLRRGIKAAIVGRDVVGEVIGLIDKLGNINGIPALMEAVGRYEANERARLAVLEDDDGIERLEDTAETIRALSEGLETIQALKDRLLELTIDTDSAKGRAKARELNVALGSCHSSKGLEWDSVYICTDKLPGPWAKTPEDVQQEENLFYVALSRTKRELVFVGVPPINLDRLTSDDELEDEPEHCDACNAPLDNEGPLCSECVEEPTPEPEKPELISTKMLKLPTAKTKGNGEYVGCTIEQWETIRDAYRAIGISAELVKPERWHMLALWIGGCIRVSTTVNQGAPSARKKGANAIDMVFADDINGRPTGGKCKTLRRDAWQGRVFAKINTMLRRRGDCQAV